MEASLNSYAVLLVWLSRNRGNELRLLLSVVLLCVHVSERGHVAAVYVELPRVRGPGSI